MVARNSYLIIGDLLGRNSFLINLIENFEGPYILIDCTGLLAKIIDAKKIILPNDKLKISIDGEFLTETLSYLLNFDSHLKLHLWDAISKFGEANLRVNSLIEKLASTSNPFIHSPSDIIHIEALIYELNTLREIDDIINEKGFSLLSNEDIRLVIDLSKIINNKVKKLIVLLIMFELAHSKNKNADLSLIIEGPEGKSLIGSKFLNEIILELHDRLLLNDISLCLTANYDEVNLDFMSRFKIIYFIKNNEVITMNGFEILGQKIMNLDNNKERLKYPFYYEKLSMIDRDYVKKDRYKSKSILELLFGDRSDLIADILLALEKNMISKKEFKNLVLSFGYFGDYEELLNELIKEDLIEERIIGGSKKLTASSKGLFLAKSHKQR